MIENGVSIYRGEVVSCVLVKQGSDIPHGKIFLVYVKTRGTKKWPNNIPRWGSGL